MPRQYHHFAEEGYKQNVIVHRCISEIARTIAMVPLYVKDKISKHKLPTHPLSILLNQPHPLEGQTIFIEHLISDWMISGNAYIQISYDAHNKPCELFCLRPDRVKIIPGHFNAPLEYHYVTAKKTRSFKVDAFSGLSDIIHLKNYHPLDDWYGLSSIEAAAFSIDQHNAAGAHNQSLLQNGARPLGALIYKSPSGHALSQSQRENLKEQLKSHYSGAHNAGKMLVLEGDFEWQEMGLRPRDMDFIAAKNTAARDIAQAFGVPAVLIGIPGDATYSNLSEARMALWEQTIIPLLDQMVNVLNTGLVPKFKETIKIGYDLDHIPALSKRRQEMWDKIKNTDFLTVNEKREILGFAPLNEDQFNHIKEV